MATGFLLICGLEGKVGLGRPGGWGFPTGLLRGVTFPFPATTEPLLEVDDPEVASGGERASCLSEFCEETDRVVLVEGGGCGFPPDDLKDPRDGKGGPSLV